MNKRVHFIDINDPMMYSLAICLQHQGYQISVSAAVLTEPIQQQLQQHHLLPPALGWFPNNITQALNQVIIHRQLSRDNPELQAALRLGIQIHNYSQYIYNYSQDKQRIVITGGLESEYVYAVAMHALRYWHRPFDYVCDSSISNLGRIVQLTDAPMILLQADALPTSTLDKTPQFLTYQHNIVVISGISQEYDQVYSTTNDYLRSLEALADATPKGGILIYNQTASGLRNLGQKSRKNIQTIHYEPFAYHDKGKQAYLTTPLIDLPISSLDPLSLQAIPAAQLLVQNLGIDEAQFYESIPSFNLNYKPG